MPLMKRAQNALESAAQGNTIEPRGLDAQQMSKPAVTMTKDDYWRHREERDIEKDRRISRQGMFQAALQSTGLLQLNVGNTLEDYLKLIEQTAERGLEFAGKKAN